MRLVHIVFLGKSHGRDTRHTVLFPSSWLVSDNLQVTRVLCCAVLSYLFTGDRLHDYRAQGANVLNLDIDESVVKTGRRRAQPTAWPSFV